MISPDVVDLRDATVDFHAKESFQDEVAPRSCPYFRLVRPHFSPRRRNRPCSPPTCNCLRTGIELPLTVFDKQYIRFCLCFRCVCVFGLSDFHAVEYFTIREACK